MSPCDNNNSVLFIQLRVVQRLDNRLDNGRGCQGGIRLPLLPPGAVVVVADAPHEQEAVLAVAHDRLEHLVELGIERRDAVLRREVQPRVFVLDDRATRPHDPVSQAGHVVAVGDSTRHVGVLHFDDLVLANVHIQAVGRGRGSGELRLLVLQELLPFFDVLLPGGVIGIGGLVLLDLFGDPLQDEISGRPVFEDVVDVGFFVLENLLAVVVDVALLVAPGEEDVPTSQVFVVVGQVRDSARHAHHKHVFDVLKATCEITTQVLNFFN